MLTRVGFDNLAGYLDGLAEWEARGYPVTSGDIQDIDPRELENRIANDSRLVILDVREPWEFRNGHVPNAKLIPLGQLQTRYTELDPEMPVAVICQSGNRSQTGAALLAQKGFKQIFNVREGTVGWKRRGFPIES
jgi:rhodanese-related sulfurtransferase